MQGKSRSSTKLTNLGALASAGAPSVLLPQYSLYLYCNWVDDQVECIAMSKQERNLARHLKRTTSKLQTEGEGRLVFLGWFGLYIGRPVVSRDSTAQNSLGVPGLTNARGKI